jgi:IS30 family transposase
MTQITYHHLTLEERDTVARLWAQGRSLGQIAQELRRNKGTISRELKRNGTQIRKLYGAAQAHQRACLRKSEAGHRPRLKNKYIRTYVRKQLLNGWSPELIAGRLRKLPSKPQRICPESIYRFIYDPAARRNENLVPCLARAHKRRLALGHRHTHRDLHIPERISIRKRPAAVEHRRQAGHWENDSAMARVSKAAVNVLVERTTRLTKLSRLPRRTAHETSVAIVRSLSHLPSRLRRTITYDNGAENVEHQRTNSKLHTLSFFCEPFHSWEKGTVENTIGLVRRFYPKKTNFDRVSVKELKRVERWLNNRPRKVLHYDTPRERYRRIVALPH